MPEMDGLELVVEVRKSFPLVPIILMTAFGSEEIAIQALQKGAASYVPKRNLATDLAETVENVLGLAVANRNQQRLLECLTQTEEQFLLDNDATLIPPLIGYLQENITRMGLCDEIGRIRVSIALQEALLNAMQHGNLEVSSDLRQEDERVFHDLIELMVADPSATPRAARLLFVAKHLERVADYVTDICELTVYMTEAEFIKHSY
jgi:CheY-like chemotaxis protein